MLLEMCSWCITTLSTEEMLIHFPLERKLHQCKIVIMMPLSVKTLSDGH